MILEYSNPMVSISKSDLDKRIANAKAEAIKEFAKECAERFKQRENDHHCSWCAHSTSYGNRARECDMDNGNGRVRCFFFDQWESCVDNIIDNLVKEMTK